MQAGASSSTVDTSSEMLICITDQTTTFTKCINGSQKSPEEDMNITDAHNSIVALDHPMETRDLRITENQIIHIEDFGGDPHGPTQVGRNVKIVINRWGPVEPINPERFFLKMLTSRGYATKMIPALTSQNRRYSNQQFAKHSDVI